MDEHIDMDDPLSRAYWCGNFSCSDAELVSAAHIMDNTAVERAQVHFSQEVNLTPLAVAGPR
ncbi:hypothetical protein RHOFW104T7_11805 [Rhodanobacter thiooxydans]|uniref:DUF3606 domain-containing protein n=1 Tax=Rhodanobacter thiooxydans TaxID=416169 RepID=A0A154QI78_9GAMM|nr:hypothetical protein UUA_12098 [Rhodanobacter thiooxydans LCS2]KZC23829.1 hypothetical protein RHOFW104T7_11805 [Rhodanobacter thiooxydans]